MIWSSHRGELVEISPSYYYEVFICEFSWNEVVTLGIGVVLLYISPLLNLLPMPQHLSHFLTTVCLTKQYMNCLCDVLERNK